ncbi:MAG TPA: hypothetical protein VMS08_03445 [Candidatus Saccharimonadia bacterium]|nr:hypothetical protein [Candidatus Saccharimonadia bacterium]
MAVVLTPFDLLDTNEALLKLAAAINDGGGGGNTTTLIADTDIAGGTSVSLNSSGKVQQTWGPAPQIANTETLLSGPLGFPPLSTGAPPIILSLSETLLVAFQPAVFAFGASIGSGPGVVALSLSGNDIDVGSPSSAGGLQNVQSAAAINSTSFIFTYIDASSDLYIQAAPVSGTTIGAPGTAQLVASGGKPTNQQQAGLVVLPGGATAVLTYYDNSNQVWCVPVAITGIALELGTPVDTNLPSGITGTYAVPLPITGTSFLVVFVDATGGANTVSAMIGTVSSNAITLYGVATVPNTTGYLPVAVMLNGTTFALSWGDQFPGTLEQKVFSVIGVISGTAIAFGNPVVTVNLSSAAAIPWTGITSDAEFWVFAAGTEPTFASVLGTTITPTIGASIPVLFNASPNGLPFNSTFSGTNGYLFPPIIGVGSGLFWLDGLWNLYEETSDGNVSPSIAHPGIINYGFAPINDTSALAVLMDGATNLIARVVNFEPINKSTPVGFVSSAYSEGDECTITFSGVAFGFSGLTPGTVYYSNGDGTLTDANLGKIGLLAGTARTNSTILLQRGAG